MAVPLSSDNLEQVRDAILSLVEAIANLKAFPTVFQELCSRGLNDQRTHFVVSIIQHSAYIGACCEQLGQLSLAEDLLERGRAGKDPVTLGRYTASTMTGCLFCLTERLRWLFQTWRVRACVDVILNVVQECECYPDGELIEQILFGCVADATLHPEGREMFGEPTAAFYEAIRTSPDFREAVNDVVGEFVVYMGIEDTLDAFDKSHVMAAIRLEYGAAINLACAAESKGKTQEEEKKPSWDGVRLKYDKDVLRSYQKKTAPEQAAILQALEIAGWPTHAVLLPEACWSTLNKTIQHINEKIKDGIIRIQAAGDGKSVIWSKSQEVS